MQGTPVLDLTWHKADGPVAWDNKSFDNNFWRESKTRQSGYRRRAGESDNDNTKANTHSFAPTLLEPGPYHCLSTLRSFLTHLAGHCSSPRWLGQSSYSPTNMAVGTDGASSIQVTVRVRPFTIREAAQLARTDDGPLFLGDGSLAAAPAPHMKQKGIRPVLKVVDEKCL
jgi:hypothetical protein